MSRLRALLIVSAALNMFAFGAIASYLLTKPSPPRMAGSAGFNDPVRGPLVGPHELDLLLSDDGLKIRDQSMRTYGPRFEKAMTALFEARTEALKVAGQDPWNPEAMEQAFDSIRQADSGLTDLTQQVIIDLLGKLSDEDRHKVVEASLRRQRFGPPMPPPPPGAHAGSHPPPPHGGDHTKLPKKGPDRPEADHPDDAPPPDTAPEAAPAQ